MLVFGGQRPPDQSVPPVYVSHLPMFMAPHNYQVIARVTGEMLDRFVDFVAHFGESEADIYTFRPQPFPMNELDPTLSGSGPTQIRGDLFRGHFERGGSEISTATSFDVDQVIYFARLPSQASSAGLSTLRYVCFGEPGNTFAAHLITSPPDFDQVLEVNVNSTPAVTADSLRAGVIGTVTAPSDGEAGRLQPDQDATLEVAGGDPIDAGRLGLHVTRELYLETGDLAAAM
jgi:hypothetical protein